MTASLYHSGSSPNASGAVGEASSARGNRSAFMIGRRPARRPSAGVMQVLAEHVGCDQRNALFGYVKTLTVLLGIEPCPHARRNVGALVDDDAAQFGTASDLHIGKDHGLIDRAVTVHAHAREQQRTFNQ